MAAADTPPAATRAELAIALVKQHRLLGDAIHRRRLEWALFVMAVLGAPIAMVTGHPYMATILIAGAFKTLGGNKRPSPLSGATRLPH